MTITIDLKPEVAAELARQAEARGMDVPAYATTLLEVAAHVHRSEKSRSLEEFEKTLDRIAQFSDQLPVLSDDAFSRDSLYQDHD